MIRRRLVSLLASLVALSLAGCGDGGAAEVLDGYQAAKLENSDDVKQWSGSASAPKIFFFALTPILMVDLAQQIGGDTSCPEVITEGSKKTYKGGCTDKAGKQWFGTAVSESLDREQANLGLIRYEGFGFEGTETCGGQTVPSSLKADGEIQGESDGKLTLDINLRLDINGVQDDCTQQSGTLAFDYVATMEKAASGQKWNGKGWIGSSAHGKLEASTVDQVIDQQVCQYEATSGTSSLKSGKDTVVVTYDGASDCDKESTAQWSLNGQGQGELAGLGCSTGGGGMSIAGGALMALLALLPRRRRD
jgi:uncharacterized protein (TIGR03382 family)